MVPLLKHNLHHHKFYCLKVIQPQRKEIKYVDPLGENQMEYDTNI